VTDSAQYYNNGLQQSQSPHKNKNLQSSSIPRNRDNSGSSMGTRKSLAIQSKPTQQNIGGYLRMSQQKSAKSGASRNQPQVMGGPVNTQNSKQQHRSFNSIN